MPRDRNPFPQEGNYRKLSDLECAEEFCRICNRRSRHADSDFRYEIEKPGREQDRYDVRLLSPYEVRIVADALREGVPERSVRDDLSHYRGEKSPMLEEILRLEGDYAKGRIGQDFMLAARDASSEGILHKAKTDYQMGVPLSDIKGYLKAGDNMQNYEARDKYMIKAAEKIEDAPADRKNRRLNDYITMQGLYALKKQVRYEALMTDIPKSGDQKFDGIAERFIDKAKAAVKEDLKSAKTLGDIRAIEGLFNERAEYAWHVTFAEACSGNADSLQFMLNHADSYIRRPDDLEHALSALSPDDGRASAAEGPGGRGAGISWQEEDVCL